MCRLGAALRACQRLACLECGHFATPQVDVLVELGLLAYDEEGRGTYDEAARYSTGLPWRFRDEVD